MDVTLLPHPSTPAPAVKRLTVEFAQVAGHRLHLAYRLAGDTEALVWPQAQPGPRRADGLWRHTCFEAFLQAPGGEYWEYNLSPSGAWAAYEFSGYRADMKPLASGADPAIDCQRGPNSFELSATLDLQWLAVRHSLAALRLGLTAVIEDRSRVLSYFALEHAAEKPDFHHAGGFAAVLAPVKEQA
jgi:hypothetical protein